MTGTMVLQMDQSREAQALPIEAVVGTQGQGQVVVVTERAMVLRTVELGVSDVFWIEVTAGLAPGETVLVHNAGGGGGIAAIQLARLRRATVIGTASPMKHAALRSFGVEHVIDYTHASVLDEVARITRGRGVDVVLDPIGGRSFADSYRMLAPLGRLVMFGLSAAAPGERRSWWKAFRAWRATPHFNAMSLINRNRGVFGLHAGHLWDQRAQLAPLMEMLVDELRAGRLQPVVAKTFPLERAADAHRFIQGRGNIGKVVLTM